MTTNQKLLDWLDDLCVRFIVNLPHEELQSVERICFQIEEAQWFYEDFIRPLDPSLPSMNLRVFSQRMFQHCPLFSNFTANHRDVAYEQFLQYKTRVPVRGAIMLNQEMTHAVLVKGWKKGAKWSFPRGKINKDELDLDCAVREVYEETGLDLHEAGLVLPEEQMKSIHVTMREQSLKLYVFRGVPMDTNFEPRTRKEISKIDWYKLSDLPTLRRKNHPQGNGHDPRDNSFYMVTPFIAQLKSWIKSQRQLEKQNRSKQASAHMPPPAAAGITDTELEGDFGDTTADEAPVAELNSDGGNFAELVANLGRSHRASDALPEVQVQQSTVDPAAELKRLLSVGGGFPPQAQMLETPSVQTTMSQSNPLMDMLQGNNNQRSNPIPTTPFEQMLPTPQIPQSPHGQHHPRQPHFEQMPPPPYFPFPPQGHAFQGSQHQPHMLSQPNNGFLPQPQSQFFPPLQHHHAFPTHPPNMQHPFVQQPPRRFGQNEESLYAPSQGFQNQRGPAVPPASKLPPPKLTAHTLGLLNAFKLNEKPAGMSPQSPRGQLQGFHATPTVTQPPPLQRAPESFISSPVTQSANPYAPSPPAFQSPPLMNSIQPAQPRPRNAHQNSLLNLFRSPSMASATPELAQPHEKVAELSAVPPTPGHARVKSGHKADPPMLNMSAKPIMNAVSPQANRPGNTSATVRGPVNAPDFDTVKKNTHHTSNRTSRGPSPAVSTKAEQKTFVPQQILRREGTPKHAAPRPGSSSHRSPRTEVATKTAFKPQILKRPQQPNDSGTALPTRNPVTSPVSNSQADLLNLFKSQVSPKPAAQISAGPTQPIQAASLAPKSNNHAQELLGLFKSPTPAPAPQRSSSSARPVSHERTTSDMPPPSIPAPTDQKAALLSLFQNSKSSPSPSSPSPLNPVEQLQHPARLTQSPAPIARTGINTGGGSPAGAKNIISSVVSPVSPLPTGGSAMSTPAHAMSRSRISSIGDSIAGSSFPGLGVAAGVSAPRNVASTSYPHPLNGLGAGEGVGVGFGGIPGGSSISSGIHVSGDAGFEHPLAHATATAANAKTNSAAVAAPEKTIAAASSSAAGADNNKTFLLGFLNDFANKGR